MNRRPPVLVLLTLVSVLALVLPLAATAQPVVRVPADAPGLQQAIQVVPNGGIVELAPGSYPSPAGGFRIRNAGKGFTIRSAAGGRAVIDGGGERPLLLLSNGDLSRGGLVRFENLTFRRGRAADEPQAGGVTVRTAEAAFVGCLFEDNVTRSGFVGAGLSVGDGSRVSVQSSTFRRNLNDFFGGGLGTVDSVVTVDGSRFVDNRTNIAGHEENAVGGGLFVLSSEVTVTDAVFEGNQAALVGGAIYVFGIYGQGGPDGTGPDAEVRVARSTFRDNRAFPNACCPTAAPSGAGALHVEDNASVEIADSYFTGNRGRFGGAVGTFRARLDVAGSIFEDNLATEPGRPRGIGSAVVALSSNGVPQGRAPAWLTVRDSLLRGRLDGSPAAGSGGCLAASGDTAELAVGGGGGLAGNRAPIRLERVAFAGCTAESEDGPTFGGAAALDLVALTARRVLVLGSEADGTIGLGGGISARLEPSLELERVTFAGNAAERFGGGLLAIDAPEVTIADGRFFDNRVGDGAAGQPRRSRGAALFTESEPAPPGPGRSPDARGSVTGSLFVANRGLPVRDVAMGSGRNTVQYLGNRFFATAFAPLVYAHDPLAPDGLTVSGLDAFVAPGSPAVDKGSGNLRLTSEPAAGDLLVFPPAGASSDPSPAFAAYAWSGRRATLATPGGSRALAARHGVIRIDPAMGDYALRVDGTPVATDRLAAATPPLPAGPFLSAPDLPDFRFKVRIVAAGATIPGRQEPVCIPETVCVSGAVPGRSEIFLRVVGPKPNGFLQPTLVKFSTSEVRIWAEQISTGTIRYYELDRVQGTQVRLWELDGLVDRTGFRPAGAAAAGLESTGELHRERLRGPAATALALAKAPPPVPPGARLTHPAFPGFFFTVRISAAGETRLGHEEPGCIPETLCVSGAVPGRSEVFLRIVGPKPNGYLQPTLVRFSTSTIEVWIERPATGDTQYYRLEGVTGDSGDLAALDGAIDREGFLP